MSLDYPVDGGSGVNRKITQVVPACLPDIREPDVGSRSVGIFQKDHSLPVVSAGIAVGQQAGKRGRHLLPGRSEYPVCDAARDQDDGVLPNLRRVPQKLRSHAKAPLPWD